MALFNKIGSLTRQSISQITVSNRHMTGPPMYNAFRCISSKFFTDDRSLEKPVSGFGEGVEGQNGHPEGINNTVADLHDQHGDMRLNVDNMSYEEEYENGDDITTLNCGHDFLH
ncbi:hypothetical protein Tco_0776322 [Tanacetum coccineum]